MSTDTNCFHRITCFSCPHNFIESFRKISVDTLRLSRLLTSLGTDLLYAFTSQTFDPDATIHSRAFAPKLGIPEDPATGSAAGAAGAYLSRNKFISKENCENIFIEQGHMMGRPSSLFVCIEQNKDEIKSVRGGNSNKLWVVILMLCVQMFLNFTNYLLRECAQLLHA